MSAQKSWHQLLASTERAVELELSAILKRTRQCSVGEAILESKADNSITFRCVFKNSRPSNDDVYYIRPSKTTAKAETAPARARVETVDGNFYATVTGHRAQELARHQNFEIRIATNVDLEAMLALQERLSSLRPNPLTTSLLNGELSRARDAAPSPNQLDTEQWRAVRTALTPGCHLVWGAAGTGKTEVIKHIAENAIQQDMTVLIVAATTNSLDNAMLTTLSHIERVDRPKTNLNVVRFTRNEHCPTSSAVAAHSHLALHKAARHNTNFEVRSKAINKALVRLKSAPCQQQIDSINQQLSNFDTRFETLRRHFDDLASIDALQREQREKQSLLIDLEMKIAQHEKSLYQLASQIDSNERCRPMLLERETLARKISALELEIRQHNQRLRLLDDDPTEQEKCQRARTKLVLQRKQLLEKIATCDIELQTQGIEIAPSLDTNELCAQRDDLEAQREAFINAVNKISTELDGINHTICRIRTAHEQLSSEDIALWNSEERTRWCELEKQRLRLQTDVVETSQQIKALVHESDQLESEVAYEHQKLIETAKIVGCTFTQLAVDDDINKRTFDVVIIEDASMASPVSMFYLGKFATHSITALGDSRQHATLVIAGKDSSEHAKYNEEQLATLDYLQSNIFDWTNTRTLDDALALEDCVTLTTQHRLPHSVAELMNNFSYEGFLDAPLGVATPEPSITLLDTSRLSKDLTQLNVSNGSKWWKAGLLLTEQVVQSTDESLVVICPFSLQEQKLLKMRAIKNAAERNDCIVGHPDELQGVERDVAIFDLTENSESNWSECADFEGDDESIDAARALTIALTRAKKQLYLIGDWNFIQNSESPLMNAIAAGVRDQKIRVVNGADLIKSSIVGSEQQNVRAS